MSLPIAISPLITKRALNHKDMKKIKKKLNTEGIVDNQGTENELLDKGINIFGQGAKDNENNEYNENIPTSPNISIQKIQKREFISPTFDLLKDIDYDMEDLRESDEKPNFIHYNKNLKRIIDSKIEGNSSVFVESFVNRNIFKRI